MKDEINERLEELTAEQAELQEEIKAIAKEKKIEIKNILRKKCDYKKSERIKKLAEIYFGYKKDERKEDFMSLDSRLFHLYSKTFDRITSKRIVTKYTLESASRYSRNQTITRKIVLNKKGIGYLQEGYYWGDENRTHYLESASMLMTIINTFPKLHLKLNNPVKRELMKKFMKIAKGYVATADFEIIEESSSVNITSYIPESSYDLPSSFGVSRVDSKTFDLVELTDTYGRLTFRFKSVNGYGSHDVDLMEIKPEDEHILNQLPSDIIEALEDYVIKRGNSYKKNKEILEKLEEEMRPYIMIGDL